MSQKTLLNKEQFYLCLLVLGLTFSHITLWEFGTRVEIQEIQILNQKDQEMRIQYKEAFFVLGNRRMTTSYLVIRVKNNEGSYDLKTVKDGNNIEHDHYKAIEAWLKSEELKKVN